ncbi:hypothetical protein DUT91_11670 [Phyllobacterium salinisoli]|uniref:Uncharacterized protein n=1 Tax=Phyllobacterium salinisoli TaxID=1899321 RepID=A0A368K622_9HYPH|nr:hypothetical protein DUT91_11670 [Phyllobacterium salinisoli]
MNAGLDNRDRAVGLSIGWVVARTGLPDGQPGGHIAENGGRAGLRGLDSMAFCWHFLPMTFSARTADRTMDDISAIITRDNNGERMVGR